MQKFTHDLRSIILPSYDDLLDHLLRLLRQSISAVALTALLGTFSSLFKHLLIPATGTDLLRRTWNSVRIVFPECNSEVQRAVAEVWGSVLRRLKASRREVAVEIMAEDLAGVEDACTWAYIFACKVCSTVCWPANFLAATTFSPYRKHFTRLHRLLSHRFSNFILGAKIPLLRILAFAVSSLPLFITAKAQINFFQFRSC